MVRKRNLPLLCLYYLVLVLLVVAVLLPIIVTIGNSFRIQDAEIFNYTQKLSIYTFFPKTFTPHHYQRLFQFLFCGADYGGYGLSRQRYRWFYLC